MLKHSAIAAFAAAALALPLQALPYGDSWRWERHDDRQGHGPEKRLVEKYDRFAGSDRNARELVEGLRNDTEIELSTGSRKTSFKPATNPMGYGNVDIALSLAKASLAEHGIHKPTPEQIKAALNGGTITTTSGQRVTLPGVLKLRASGMGWGEVAHKVGVKVGDVKGHGHAHNNDDDKHHKHAKHGHDDGWKHKRHDRDDDDDRRHRGKQAKDDHKQDWKDKHHGRDDDDDRDHRGKHVKQEHKHDRHESKRDWKHDKQHDRHHGDRRDQWKHARHDKPEGKPDWKQHQKHDVKQHQNRPEFHRAKFERPERAQRPEKVERPHRPERPERPERHNHRR